MPYPSHYSTFANRCRLWLPLYWASRPSLITCGLYCVGLDMICVIADEYDWLICSHVPVYLGCSLFGMRVLQHLLYFSTVSPTLCVLLVVHALRRIMTSVELEPPTNSLWLFCGLLLSLSRRLILCGFFANLGKAARELSCCLHSFIMEVVIWSAVVGVQQISR